VLFKDDIITIRQSWRCLHISNSVPYLCAGIFQKQTENIFSTGLWSINLSFCYASFLHSSRWHTTSFSVHRRNM